VATADDDPTAEGYGAILDGDVVDVTTPVARAAKRRSLQHQQGTDPPPTVADVRSPDEPAPAADAPLPTAVTHAIHSHPTQQVPAGASSPTTDAPAQDSRMTTATSPLDAMRLEEVERMRVFLKLVIASTFFAVVAIAATPGDAFAKLVVYGGCVVVFGASMVLLWSIRDAEHYTSNRVAIGAMVIAFGASAGIYYWGVASPAVAIFVYGIYVFSLGGLFRVIIAMYLLCALLHLVLAVSIMAGVTLDRGIVRLDAFEFWQQVGLVAVPQFLFLLALLTARASRRTTFEAVSRLERAVRAVSQREAMLAEVKQELDRQLKIGGPGRYTDQSVGSFRLGILIGRGGMGEVYEATSVRDGSDAAVKLLHPATLADPQQVQRFVREAAVAAKLDSPNVVAVLEVGTTQGEIPFLAMERLRGFDLAHQLRRQRTLGMAQAVELVHQVAVGLEAARVAGIVHRDLKPHNLFLAERDRRYTWKVLDFGVSKLASHHGTLTRGHVVGTPAYMAPEQARGEDVDHRADVYALAAIVYRSLTGHPAFTGKDVPSTLYDVVYKQPTQPSQLAPALPGDVDRVIALGMAKEPAGRFQTASDFAAAFTLASRDDLPPDLRRRADDLIEKFPWGTRL
jgi:serine/threonine-protein kinase